MKRSRFSFGITLQTHSGHAGRPWPPGRARFSSDFKPQIERHRRRRRIGIGLFIGFMLGGAVLTLEVLPRAVRAWGVAVSLGGFVVSSVALAFPVKLVCPACRKRLEPASGKYCPQCGTDQLQPGTRRRGLSAARSAYCPSCEAGIAEEDGDSARSYRIRGCTHCGVMLDENGI